MNFYLLFVITCIVVFIILFLLFEMDRNFNGNSGCTMFFYYIQVFPLPLVGLYNTLIRLTHPEHKHVFQVNSFPDHAILKTDWKSIQSEALELYSKKDVLLNMNDIGVMGNFSGIDAEKGKWKVFVLKWYDEPLENAKKHCPNTVSIIEKCQHVRAAMFSILEPGKYIPPHKGPFTGCLRYHMGLKVPKDRENCYIEVNKEKFSWSEGEAFVFDDTYIHSVYNNTNEPRIILFIDIERPLRYPLNEVNRMLCNTAKFANFTKGVNDRSERSLELFHNYR